MYLAYKKSEYLVNLWEEDTETLYNTNDTLPLKTLDRNISLNCYILNKFYAFNIEWGVLKDVNEFSYFKTKDLSNIKFYNSFGELLKITDYKDLELIMESDYLFINKEDNKYKEFGKSLMNINKLHIWEIDKYNKNMRTIRRMIKTNENIISNYLNWIDKRYQKKAIQILEGIILMY